MPLLLLCSALRPTLASAGRRPAAAAFVRALHATPRCARTKLGSYSVSSQPFSAPKGSSPVPPKPAATPLSEEAELEE
jgi:hypothetical protein